MCCSNFEDHPSIHIKAKTKTIPNHVILDKNHTVSVKWWVCEKNEKNKMNLNATKRPFGHFDVHVIKQGKSGKIILYAFLK